MKKIEGPSIGEAKLKAVRDAMNDNGCSVTREGKKNIYTCDTCFGHIVTVDRDDGVTPFMINCRATIECVGTMRSSMYRVFDQSMRATFEWYKPSVLEIGALESGARGHVDKGGLLLRKI